MSKKYVILKQNEENCNFYAKKNLDFSEFFINFAP